MARRMSVALTDRAGMKPETLESLADEAFGHADRYQPLGAGLCLPVASALCHVLAARNVTEVSAIAGAYIDDAHWWVRVGSFIVDPTRPQFDEERRVVDTRIHEHWQYAPEAAFPPGWSEEHVLLEAERAFYFSFIGRQFGQELLDGLRSAVDGQEG